MTKKKLKFVEEYLKDFNQTQACIRAGYSERSARTASSRLMADVNVVSLINQRLELVRVRTNDDDQFNHAEIRKAFKAIYDRCMQAEPVMQWDPVEKQMVPVRDENGNAVYQFDANGANRAMENIAKNKGFYELDNTQKRDVIQIAIVQHDNHASAAQLPDGQEQASYTDQLTDTGFLTVLPPAAED